MPQSCRSAFTLVELLVVIAIISVLAAMLLPSLESSLEQGRRVVCANNMRQIYISGGFYATEFNDRLPPSAYASVSTLCALSDSWYPVARTVAWSTWVRDYCNAQLYTYPEAWGGVPITESFAAYKAAHPTGWIVFPRLDGRRRILQCPGTLVGEFSTAAGYRNAIDYWPSAFGPFIASTSNNPPAEKFYFTHYSRAALLANGVRKSFCMDNVFMDSYFQAPTLYTNATGHRPGDPQGGNVTAGDGAVAWVSDWTNVIPLGSARGVPKGYFTLSSYGSTLSPTAYQGINYYNENGAAVTVRTNTDPSEFARACGMWF